jgi:hypothetical protein
VVPALLPYGEIQAQNQRKSRQSQSRRDPAQRAARTGKDQKKTLHGLTVRSLPSSFCTILCAKIFRLPRLETIQAENISRPWKVEDSMSEFEIRILNSDGSPSVMTTLNLFSTQSAVGSALRLARGRPFEVWREGRCVYCSLAGISAAANCGTSRNIAAHL